MPQAPTPPPTNTKAPRKDQGDNQTLTLSPLATPTPSPREPKVTKLPGGTLRVDY